MPKTVLFYIRFIHYCCKLNEKLQEQGKKIYSIPAMKTEDLHFIGDDPGAVKHGNFINYYSFHSAKERIDSLCPEMFLTKIFEPILCLDIGCNTGELTNELLSYLKTIYSNSNIYFLGVDIDPVLIQRAKESYNSDQLSFASVNVMVDKECKLIRDYLNAHKKTMFDITFGFSVTMWIHLNNGDDGLKEFLKYIKEISKTIVIEPQPWSCYKNAQRRVKKSGSSFPLYEKLKIRSNVQLVIEKILNESTHRKVYESTANSWKRVVQSYHQI